jgi:hypothetical protein
MEKNSKVYNAIAALTNNAEWVWNGDDYANIEWITKGVKAPTEAQIEAKIAEMEADEAAKKNAAIAKLTALGLTADDLKAIS